MFKKVTYSIKDFFRRVHNVYRWLPTIWKDRDWDHSYINEILIKKLEFTRDFYLSDKAYNAEADEVAEQIQEAIDRLNQSTFSVPIYVWHQRQTSCNISLLFNLILALTINILTKKI